jgi:ketosteroid isomerase-like protein
MTHHSGVTLTERVTPRNPDTSSNTKERGTPRNPDPSSNANASTRPGALHSEFEKQSQTDQFFNHFKDMRSLTGLLILAMAFIACQKKTKVEMSESKNEVAKVLDAHWAALKSKDADAVIALVSEDFLSCGSDPEEFWNKTDMYNTVKQTLANSELKIDITVDRREIRIAKDGNSAIAFEQMFLTPFSQKIPVRTVYHLVKENNTWLIDFTSTGFLPNNEDIEKLNKALE